jgi:hypothetical protein
MRGPITHAVIPTDADGLPQTIFPNGAPRLSLGAASASRPYLGFSLGGHLLVFAGCSQTAEDCRFYNAPSVPPRLRESPCFLKTAETAVLPSMRLWVLA